jgi:hypothetical protein
VVALIGSSWNLVNLLVERQQHLKHFGISGGGMVVEHRNFLPALVIK